MKIGKMGKNRNIGLAISYLYFVFNTIIGILISGFLVRKIGSETYGVYQTVSAFVSYLVLLEFGTGTIMARNISLCQKSGKDNAEVKRNVSTIWTLTLILSVAIVIVSCIFYFSLDNLYAKSMNKEQITLSKHIFVFSALNLLLSFNTHTLNGVILGHEHYVFEKSFSLLRLLVRTSLVVGMLVFRSDIMLVVLIDTGMAILTFVVTLLYCITQLRVVPSVRFFDRTVFMVITPLCLAMLLQTIVNTANSSVGKFAIGIIMTPKDVTLYTISMSLFNMFSSIATLPITMYMPQIASNIKNGLEGEELTTSLIPPCRLNVLVTGVIAFGVFTVGRQFIEIVYGSEYSSAWFYAMILIFPAFINLSNGVIVNVMDVLRKRHIRSLILMFTTALNIVMTIMGIRMWGMFGAAAATGISIGMQIVIINIYYQKAFHINVIRLAVQSYKGILPFLIIASAIGFSVRYIFRSIIVQFFVGGFLFCGIFAILYILFGSSEREKEKLEQFKQILKNARNNEAFR